MSQGSSSDCLIEGRAGTRVERGSRTKTASPWSHRPGFPCRESPAELAEGRFPFSMSGRGLLGDAQLVAQGTHFENQGFRGSLYECDFSQLKI